MANIVDHNPYRILGVYANSPQKDIVANIGKATAFLNVGKSVEYPLDLKGLLPPLPRTLNMMNEAMAHLAVSKEKLKYAQFWFIKMTPLDEVAFNHLFAGNLNEAKEIWSKQENLSSLQNKLICNLIENETKLAIAKAEQLYTRFGNEYVNRVDVNNTLKISGEELLFQFVDTLSEVISAQKLLQYKLCENLRTHIVQKTVAPLIGQLSAEVENAKKTDRKNAKARWEAGHLLIAKTQNTLEELRTILGENDFQYQTMADKIGLEILQCGIDYFNNSNDDERYELAMSLQKHAQSIVLGTLAQQRCDENVKILHKIIGELPPKDIRAEDRAIKDALSQFQEQSKFSYDDPYVKWEWIKINEKLLNSYLVSIFESIPKKISYSVSLLNNAKPHLRSIRQKMGEENAYYLKTSTIVVGEALHNVIAEVNRINRILSDPVIAINVRLEMGAPPFMMGKIKNVFRSAWNAFTIMDDFDLEANFKSHYNGNRSTLESMCIQIGIPTNTSGSPSPNKPSASGSSGGCYIATMAYGSYEHPQVMILRNFRDDYLAQRMWGREFIEYYYKHSPIWVEKLKNYKVINRIIRCCLDGFILFLNKYKNR